MTKIEWADETWNPITGCSPISEGCKNCYAARMAKRLAGRFGYPEAPNQFDVTFRPDKISINMFPWGKKVFVCSMGDLFHNDVPAGAMMHIMNVIIDHPDTTFMMLTKRPKKMEINLRGASETMIAVPYEYRLPLENLWIGVTAENQKRADERIPILLQIPAAVRFVSVEPMLEEIELYHYLYPITDGPGSARPALDWVIAGPETGPGARPCDPKWIEYLYEQCRSAGVPFFDKRKKDWLAREFPAGPDIGGRQCLKC